jgi:hypothetical protein
MPNIVKLDSFRDPLSGTNNWSAQEARNRVVGMLSQLGRAEPGSKDGLQQVIVALDIANAATQQIIKQVRREPKRRELLDWSSNIQTLIETVRNRVASL